MDKPPPMRWGFFIFRSETIDVLSLRPIDDARVATVLTLSYVLNQPAEHTGRLHTFRSNEGSIRAGSSFGRQPMRTSIARPI